MEVKGGSEGDGSSGGQGVGCCAGDVGFGAPGIIAEPLRESDTLPELPPLGQVVPKEVEVLVLSFLISTRFEEVLLIEEDLSGGGCCWTDVEFRRLNTFA